MSFTINATPYKIILPPISNLLDGLPSFNLNTILIQNTQPFIIPPRKKTLKKTSHYSLTSDLLILQHLFQLFGNSFNGVVPWSFWQSFKDATGHPRTCSSLYHHWKGAMSRKYGHFLKKGKLCECISWIQTLLNEEKTYHKN